VHFAFVYISTADDGARWTVDDVSIINSPTPPRKPDGEYNRYPIPIVANGSTTDKTFSFVGNDLTDPVTLNATGVFLVSKECSVYYFEK